MDQHVLGLLEGLYVLQLSLKLFLVLLGDIKDVKELHDKVRDKMHHSELFCITFRVHSGLFRRFLNFLLQLFVLLSLRTAHLRQFFQVFDSVLRSLCNLSFSALSCLRSGDEFICRVIKLSRVLRFSIRWRIEGLLGLWFTTDHFLLAFFALLVILVFSIGMAGVDSDGLLTDL